MSYSKNSVFPKIVTDGLILYLDATNPRSYPGSGTDWFDLTRYRSDATLAPTTLNSSFVSGTPNYIDVNSISSPGDQYGVKFNLPITSEVVTIDLWGRFPYSYGIGIIFGFSPSIASNTHYWVGFSPFAPDGSELGWGAGNDFRYLINSTSPLGTAMPSFTDWYNLVFIMYTNTPYTSNKGYINSVEYSQGGGTETVADFGNKDAWLGSWGPTGNQYPSQYDCNSFKVYNRALSASEIQQNYNALKSRFGHP